MDASGSIEIPRVIVGLGSVKEVACAFPFRANIADGLALERLALVGGWKGSIPAEELERFTGPLIVNCCTRVGW